MCTRAFMNMYPGYLVCARGLDFFGPADPALVITPRGVEHSGSDEPDALCWQTRYGSVMIYASGLFPMDGMNEKGLAGHTLYYSNGVQEQRDGQHKPQLDSRAWLSWLLDNHATVADAVAGLSQVRLAARKLPIDYATDTKHIALEDASGDSAIVEIDDGEVRIYHHRDYRVMTNPPTYAEHLANLEKYRHVDADHLPATQGAEDRFVRAALHLHNLPKPDSADQARGFVRSVLANQAFPIGYPDEDDPMVRAISEAYQGYSKFPQENKGTATYWSTLSDLSHGEYWFTSVFAASSVWVRLQEIDFSAGQPVRQLDHLHHYAERGLQGNILAQLTPR